MMEMGGKHEDIYDSKGRRKQKIQQIYNKAERIVYFHFSYVSLGLGFPCIRHQALLVT